MYFGPVVLAVERLLAEGAGVNGFVEPDRQRGWGLKEERFMVEV